MSYDVKVTATMDPCALREHEYVVEDFGLAALTKQSRCVRCGRTWYPRFQPEIGHIERVVGIWAK